MLCHLSPRSFISNVVINALYYNISDCPEAFLTFYYVKVILEPGFKISPYPSQLHGDEPNVSVLEAPHITLALSPTTAPLGVLREEDLI